MSERSEIPHTQTLNTIRGENRNKNSSEQLGPIVPVALQYMFMGSTTVQGPNTEAVQDDSEQIKGDYYIMEKEKFDLSLQSQKIMNENVNLT